MHTRTYIAVGALLLAALGCRDDTTAPTAPASPTPQATVAAATALAFRQLSTGAWFSCGVTTD